MLVKDKYRQFNMLDSNYNELYKVCNKQKGACHEARG